MHPCREMMEDSGDLTLCEDKKGVEGIGYAVHVPGSYHVTPVAHCCNWVQRVSVADGISSAAGVGFRVLIGCLSERVSCH